MTSEDREINIELVILLFIVSGCRIVFSLTSFLSIHYEVPPSNPKFLEFDLCGVVKLRRSLGECYEMKAYDAD